MNREELSKVVEEFKNGDKSKFEEIYLSTNSRLFNYIFSISDSLNEEDCYELLQETYISVNNKIHTLKECSAFNSWMYTIARNKTLRYLEKKKKEILLSDEGDGIFENQHEIDVDLLPEEILDNKEKKKMILDIIDSLPGEQKEVILLRYYNGLSVKEIASQLNISDGTVKSRLNYGRKKIETEVVALEKKGTKLYGTSLPIILLLLRGILKGDSISLQKEREMLNSISNEIAFRGISSTSENNRISTNSKVVSSVKSGAYVKLVAAGAAVACLVGGAVLINKMSTDETEDSKKTIVSEVIDKEEVNEDIVRIEVNYYKSDVESVCEVTKFNNLFGKDGEDLWNIDEFINEICLIDEDDGSSFYSSTNPIWAVSWLENFILCIENVIEGKEEILRCDDITIRERDILKECEEMLEEFVNSQEKLDSLNDRLKEVSLHNGNDRAQESAIEFNTKFEEYKKLLNKL